MGAVPSLAKRTGILSYCAIHVNKQLIRHAAFSIMVTRIDERLSMTATKRKLLYGLVVLLFLLIIMLIGWLAYSLFALRIAPPQSVPAASIPLQHQQSGAGPFSETLINIEGLPETATGTAGQTDAATDEPDATATAGHIPCICEGYGPEITSRAAHENPLAHQTVFSATRAIVTLTLPPKQQRGDQ